MNKETARLALDCIKALATLLIVCSAILISLGVLLDADFFSVKKVCALAVLLEAIYTIRSVV